VSAQTSVVAYSNVDLMHVYRHQISCFVQVSLIAGTGHCAADLSAYGFRTTFGGVADGSVALQRNRGRPPVQRGRAVRLGRTPVYTGGHRDSFSSCRSFPRSARRGVQLTVIASTCRAGTKLLRSYLLSPYVSSGLMRCSMPANQTCPNSGSLAFCRSARVPVKTSKCTPKIAPPVSLTMNQPS
jgi:hypothetical protein